MKRKLSVTAEEVNAKRQKLETEIKDKKDAYDKCQNDLKAVNEAKEKALTPHFNAIKKIEEDFKEDISRLDKIEEQNFAFWQDLRSTGRVYELFGELSIDDDGKAINPNERREAFLLEIPNDPRFTGPEYVKALNELFGGYIPCNGYILLDTYREAHDGGWRTSGYYEVHHDDLEEDDMQFGDYICKLPEGINMGYCDGEDPEWHQHDRDYWEPFIKESLKDAKENLDWEDDKRYRTYTLKMRIPMAWVTLVDLPGKIPFVVPK